MSIEPAAGQFDPKRSFRSADATKRKATTQPAMLCESKRTATSRHQHELFSRERTSASRASVTRKWRSGSGAMRLDYRLTCQASFSGQFDPLSR